MVNESVIPDYSLTIYMGIQADSGPDDFQLLEDVNDLYMYFNTYNRSDSYNMAEFCLLHGYRVLAHKVNVITGPASCRKFIVGDQSFFFSPRQGVDYSEAPPSPFNPYSNPEKAVYSQIVTFHDTELPATGNLISENFVIIVPKQGFDVNRNPVTVNVPFSNCGYTREQLAREYAIDAYTGTFLDREYGLNTSNFRETVLTFFERQCNLTVTPIENDENRYLIVSQTDISDLIILSPKVNSYPELEAIIESQPSDIGVNDNYCRLYNSYQVCSLYTKVNSCIDDTKVDIVRSDEYYYVNVYKYDSDNIPVITESFQYSIYPDNINYISNLSFDSELVEIDVFDEDADLSGLYQLKGQEGFREDLDFYNSILESTTEEGVDVCIDNSPSNLSLDYRQAYISNLRSLYPNSLILTDSSSPDSEQIVNIGPDVTWLDTGYTMKGLTYLLYLLPQYDAGSDTYALRVEKSDDVFDNTIEERDYEVTLIGVRSRLNSVFPIKSLLSVLAIENYIVNRGGSIRSVGDFERLTSEAVNTINNYLGTNTTIEISNLLVQDNKLSANLVFRTDTYMVYTFKITATLLW